MFHALTALAVGPSPYSPLRKLRSGDMRMCFGMLGRWARLRLVR